MKRLTFIFLAIVIIIFDPYCAVSEELDVPFHRQQTVVWCWAATVGMVGEYLTGISESDCEILSAYDRMLGGPGLCCNFPMRCTRTGNSNEMKLIMSRLFGLSGYHHARPLSYQQLRKEIDENHPIIAFLQGGYSGHVVVISGYKSGKRVVILDPMSGRHVIPYKLLRRNWQIGVWAETITFDDPNVIDDNDDDDDPIPYCCDRFGQPRCEIEFNAGPPGSPCFCPGQGYGFTCY